MKRLKQRLDSLPSHVAFIMDGNGTWAKRRGLPRNFGHKMGAERLVNLVYYANDLNIKYMTVYAFSTENWKRPKEEVDFLMELPIEFIEKHKDEMLKRNIKVSLIGRRVNIKPELLKKINDIEEELINNTGLHFIIAFDYGAQNEIVRAVNKVIADNKSVINEEDFANYLDTKGIPNVDLLIRTSGQIRLSNFMLWQIAYSELIFTKTLWPSFKISNFNKALKEYSKRTRRYGGLE